MEGCYWTATAPQGRTLKARVAPGGRMFPFTLETCRKLLSQILGECKLQLGWALRSARAGFASEASSNKLI